MDFQVFYAEVVGTDDISQFKGWAVFTYKNVPLLGGLLNAHHMKKLWIDYWN